MGEALGKLYIGKMFPGDSKKIALEMIQDVEAAFQANLAGLAWMDDATRRRATSKMEAIKNKIGYPDRWRDYGKLQVKPGRYFENALAARAFEFDRNLRKVGRPTDRGEWYMTPPEVNAYYNPLNNEMAFPAGILQPPFFHREHPAAMNYGGIGMVMGHELTHGFDDSGRKFDPRGRMVEWWSPEVSGKFEGSAQCVDDLYSGFEVLPGVKLNGKLTLGENIADLGGIKQAHEAYGRWVARHGEPGEQVPGLTDDQLFFVGFAQTWCTLATPEILKMLATVDTHSPPQFRVNGPLAQYPKFAEAFSCPAGSSMRPANVCTVW
jgi:endothelin-converting enzyme/putative endopeptidase